MKPSIRYEIRPVWLEIEYKGKKQRCHRDSWMAHFGVPIQDISIETLEKVMYKYEDKRYTTIPTKC